MTRPPFLSPMLLSRGTLPQSSAWAFEPKWDGFRAIAYVSEDSLRLRSRRGADLTRLAPELTRMPPAISAVLDGELVAFEDGKPSFDCLQARLTTRPPYPGPSPSSPSTWLWHEGESLTELPWTERRARLEALDIHGNGWETVEVFTDGPALFEGTLNTGFEGVVAKRTYSRYHPGIRTTAWRKTKHMRTGRFVIGGWAQDHEGRPEALLVGTREADGLLRYAGPVRFGFSARRLIEEATPSGCPTHRSRTVRWARGSSSCSKYRSVTAKLECPSSHEGL